MSYVRIYRVNIATNEQDNFDNRTAVVFVICYDIQGKYIATNEQDYFDN